MFLACEFVELSIAAGLSSGSGGSGGGGGGGGRGGGGGVDGVAKSGSAANERRG